MINLKAISYNNIGPFVDKQITIFFCDGKFLINAPIGVGKSFLFFDGPMYALYKRNSRNLLSIKAKEGNIKLRFSINDQDYIVIRKLKRGKSKDSCESKLFIIKNNLDIFEKSITNKILVDGFDFFAHINPNQLEAIDFKNETDLQQNINSFITPKEVFLSTVFLMQDSDNIFELMPADRLSVLKNIFNLMGIDDAKDIISDNKRQIQTELKIKSDTSSYDQKIKNNINLYLNDLSFFENNNLTKTICLQHKEYFNNRIYLKDKINIIDFDIKDFPIILHEEIKNIIDKNKTLQQNLIEKQKLLRINLEETTEILKVQKKEQHISQEKIKICESKISSIDINHINSLKAKKISLLQKQNELQSLIDKNTIIDFYNNFVLQNNILKNLNTINISNIDDINIKKSYDFIDSLTNIGKIIKEKAQTIQVKKDMLIQQQKNIIEQKKQDLKNITSNIDKEIFNQKEKLLNFENQISRQEKSILEISYTIDEESKFDCSKISNQCPFIKQINKKTFDKYTNHKILLEEELKRLKIKFDQENFHEKIFSLENNLLLQKQELTKINESNYVFLDEQTQNIISNYDLEIQNINNILHQIKSFFLQIDFRNIQDIYLKHEELNNIYKEVDQTISTLENDYKQLEIYKIDLEKHKNQLSITSRNIIDLEQKQIANKESITFLDKQINSQEHKTLVQLEQKFTSISQSIENIKNIIKDFTQIQLDIKILKEDEKIINNLYQIFSKELLLLVLEDSLPIISEVINNYLIQVVDYQISFDLVKQSSDKLELEVTIVDEKGKRDVKSLSGGQRVVLKLVWMLAISAHLRTPMLFLDETINNLDLDTVGRVADLLTNFVKQRDMKLYTITHSEQIKSMDIRDKIIIL